MRVLPPWRWLTMSAGRAVLLFVIAVSSMLLAVGLAGGAVGTSVAGGGRFSDPVGDAKGGPDVTRLAVGQSIHLKATGTVDLFLLEYWVANLKTSPKTGAQEREVLTSLDTNRDNTADYFVSFGVSGEQGDRFVNIYKASNLWKT